MKASRRNVLKWMGIQLALPALTGHYAQAQGMTRKRFIAGYVPNGAHMPAGANGAWTWAESLQPLVSRGHQANTMVLRGMFNGFPAADPHWQNCAGFLSCEPIELGDPGVARCGKTIDQYIAERHTSSMRSLELGGLYYHVHPLNDHPGYSNDYLNRICWQTADKFRSPIPDPAQLFAKLFGGQSGSAAQINYLHQRKRSILDSLHKDATRMSTRLPETYRPVLKSYMDTVREVELGLGTVSTCTPTIAQPTQNFSAPNTNYVLRFQLMHQMIVLAMQCDLTNVATLMYGPGVSENMNFAESIAGGAGHHAVAHHGGTQSSIDKLKQINVVQTGLLADLLTRLKTANLLNETLVLYGSDMSDGNVHLTENLPMLLCGAGADLKFGQEIGAANVRRPVADLHVEIASLLDVPGLSSFGSGVARSTGQALGIRV
jgi:hypothetical protein